MLKWFSIAAIMLPLTGLCQTLSATDKAEVPQTTEQYDFSIREIPSDVLKVVVSPFNWKKDSWLTAAALTGITALSFSVDQSTSNLFARNTNSATDNISKYAIEPWGSGLYLLPAITIAYITGGTISNKKIQFAAFKSAEAWLFAAGAAQVTKQVIHRHRPNESPCDPFIFDGPDLSSNYNSMPSGHTSTIFAVATVWARVYADQPLIGLLAYSTASIVGISRLYDQQHWLSDVVAGAAIGYWMGSTLIAPQKNNSKKLTIIPYVGNGYYQLALRWNLNETRKHQELMPGL